MLQTTLCRLCVASNNEYKSLFDDSGHLNGIYEIAVKYFDPIVLNPGNRYSSKVICMTCWQNIEHFYKFQTSVINAQTQLQCQEPIVRLTRLEDEIYNKIDIDVDRPPSPTPSFTESVIDEIDDILADTINDNPSNDLIGTPPQASTMSVFQLIQINDKPPEINSNIRRMDYQTRKQNDDFIAKWIGQLKCRICQRLFPTFSLLSRHFRIKHSGIDCYIVCCGRKISQPSKLAKHIQQLHIAKPLILKSCKFCKGFFKNNSELRDHILKLHRPKFIVKRSGRGRGGGGGREFKCDMCGAAFKRESNLKYHYRCKHKGFPLPEHCCTKCSMVFKNKIPFENHMKQHQAEEEQMATEPTRSIPQQVEAYTCNVCEKPFKRQANMMSHTRREHYMAKSSKVRSVATTKGREWTSNSTQLKLENDALIAKLMGKLKCLICKELFDTFTLLTLHFQDQHFDKECHIVCCGRKLPLRSRILRHIYKFHNDRVRNLNSSDMDAGRKQIPKSEITNKEDSIQSSTKSVSNENEEAVLENQKDITNNEKLARLSTNSDFEGANETENDQTEKIIQNEKILEKFTKSTLYEEEQSLSNFNTYTAPNRKKQLQFKCNICGKIFSRKWNMLYHKNQVHFDKNAPKYKSNCKYLKRKNDALIFQLMGKLECVLCNRVFETFTMLSLHFQEQHSGIECHIMCCNRKFSMRSRIIKHIHKKHNSHPPDKEIPAEQVQSIEIVNELDNIQMPPLSFVIKEFEGTQEVEDIKFWELNKIDASNNEEFSERSTDSVAKKTNEAELFCILNRDQTEEINQNESSTNEEEQIASDINTENTQLEFKCNLCEKSFSRNWNMLNHKNRVHFEEGVPLAKNRKYQTNCKRLKKKNDALIFQLMGKLKCGLCNRLFETFTMLSQHFQVKHQGKECHIMCCDRKLTMRSRIIKHIYKMHNTSFRNSKPPHQEIPTKQVQSIEKVNEPDNIQIHRPFVIKDDEEGIHDDEDIEFCELNKRDTCNKEDFAERSKDFLSKETSEAEFCLLSYKNKINQNESSTQSTANEEDEIASNSNSDNASDKETPLQFKCNICKKIFSRKWNMLSHKTRVHFRKVAPTRKYQSNCKRLKEKNDALILHLMGKLKCGLCNNLFDTFTMLRQHFQVKHQGIECHIMCCGRKLTMRSFIIKHFHQKHNESFRNSNPPDKEIAAKQDSSNNEDFAERSKDHLSKKTNETELFCINQNEGPIKPTTNEEEQIASNVYTDNTLDEKTQLKFKCNLCEKRFLRKGNMLKHKNRVHYNGGVSLSKNRKPKSNSYRLKKKNDNLIRQLMGKLECVFCKRLFETFTILSQHFQDQHFGNECHIICCERKFAYRSLIIKHIHKNHNENVKYPYTWDKESHVKQVQSKETVNKLEDISFPRPIVLKEDEETHEDRDIEFCDPNNTDTGNNKEFAHRSKDSDSEDRNTTVQVQTKQRNPNKEVSKSSSTTYDEEEEQILSDANTDETLDKTSKLKFKCNLCEKRFLREGNMLKHKTRVHLNEGVSYKNRYQSNSKRVKMKNDDLISELIGKLECALCNRLFDTFTLLNLHFKQKHQKKQCYIECCSLKFTLRSRIIKHCLDKHKARASNSGKSSAVSSKTTNKNQDTLQTSQALELKEEINLEEDTEAGCSAHSSRDSVLEEEDEEFEFLTLHTEQNENSPKKAITNKEVPSPSSAYTPNNNIVKEEICIYPSDIDSETDEQSESHTLDFHENNTTFTEDLTFDFFAKKSLSCRATNSQYDEFIRKWKGNLECPKCPQEMFADFEFLRQHFRLKHNNERPFIQCCGFKLVSRYPICAHLCLHNNPNAYQCPICQKSFKNRWNLESHKRHVHEGEPYCNCVKIFKQKLIKEYDLSVCCQRKEKLLENDTKIAEYKKELECWYCKMKFPYFSLLHNHFLCEHPEESFYMECCEKRIRRVNEVITHLLVH